jgi:hypothetical protein
MAKRKLTLRERIVRRARGLCEYCRSPAAFAHQAFLLNTFDHEVVKASVQRPIWRWHARDCNNHKYNRTKARDPVSR